MAQDPNKPVAHITGSIFNNDISMSAPFVQDTVSFTLGKNPDSQQASVPEKTFSNKTAIVGIVILIALGIYSFLD